MPKNPLLPDDFDPSPFKDSKDDLNHALEDIKMAKAKIQAFVEYFGPFLKKWKEFIDANLGKQNTEKVEEIPLIFIRVHPETIEQIHSDEKPEKSVFIAKLNRSNKALILGFAYDWLVGQGMIQPMVLKEEFIRGYWESHFEKIII